MLEHTMNARKSSSRVILMLILHNSTTVRNLSPHLDNLQFNPYCNANT